MLLLSLPMRRLLLLLPTALPTLARVMERRAKEMQERVKAMTTPLLSRTAVAPTVSSMTCSAMSSVVTTQHSSRVPLVALRVSTSGASSVASRTRSVTERFAALWTSAT
ncbi:hypothetical protein BDV96DRAFT_176348 [Lophiotrema nucula]|uniref:Secreted protein n=1 Tax=Lophiotrema nucula TaxID=690887 RepID=A0A6A5YYS4_9PLEO|nr:hypothetical protein BDV96DRAFT_176348 [Lophiotrema nucula]